MRAYLTWEQYQKLSQQIPNPDHCYLRTKGGRVLHHPSDDPQDPFLHLKDQPIRFTRLAAEMMISAHPGYYQMEEIPK